MPNRYEPAGGPLARVYAGIARAAGSFVVSDLPLLIERAAFGPGPGVPARGILSIVFRAHLADIEPEFDPEFYLRQLPDASRRARAARAPLLHYILVGTLERRSPHPAFDPVFYRRNNAKLSKLADPLRHYVERGRSEGQPRSECDGSSDFRLGRDCVLSLHHARGGGSSRFLSLYEQEIRAGGRNVIRLRAVAGAPTLGVLEDHDPTTGTVSASTVFDLASGRRKLAAAARQRRVTRLLVNHVIDRPLAVFDWIRDLSDELGCPYDVVLHDYYALCPRVDMIMGSTLFCDSAPVSVCQSCVASHGSQVEAVDPALWRHDSLAFLGAADRIVVPSADLAARLQPHLPSKRISLWRPEDDGALPCERTPRLGPDEPLRVIILGTLNVPKGVRVLRALAREAESIGAPLAFTLIGTSPEAGPLRRTGVKVTGAYRMEQIDGLVAEAAPHVAFIPAIWPETWSFVLTSALARGLPVVVFDIGAPAERLRRLGQGYILPADLATRPRDLLAAFLGLRQQWLVSP